MSKFYDDLKKSFEDIIDYRRGKITLRSEIIELPEPPFDYTAKDIKQIREKGCYSQSVFAMILNVNVRTVQSWELGTRVPTHSALRLLEIIDKGIYRPKIHRKHT
jgi:putative transcriptional regulator